MTATRPDGRYPTRISSRGDDPANIHSNTIVAPGARAGVMREVAAIKPDGKKCRQ